MTNEKSITAMLASIGLTANDSNVYIHLLKRGSSIGGSKLALILSIHRQYVYNSLQKLLDLGLIEAIKDGARVKYKALPPAQLTKLARKKLDEAEQLKKELDTISTVGAEQDFEVYMGERKVFDFEDHFVSTLDMDTEQFIIGGASDCFIKFFGDKYSELGGVARHKKLRSKYVGCKEEESWLKLAHETNPYFEYVILDTLPKTIINTVIRFDSVTTYSFATPPIVYILKSKVVADNYKKFFDMLWNMGKKAL